MLRVNGIWWYSELRSSTTLMHYKARVELSSLSRDCTTLRTVFMTSSTRTNRVDICKVSRHSKDRHRTNVKGSHGQSHVSRSCCARSRLPYCVCGDLELKKYEKHSNSEVRCQPSMGSLLIGYEVRNLPNDDQNARLHLSKSIRYFCSRCNNS
jgi:hypothetical protein